MSVAGGRRMTAAWLGAVAWVAAVTLFCPPFVTFARATTVTVHCPSESINDAIANAFSGRGRPPINDRLTVLIRGTCTENVRTVPLREVWLIGQNGAVLQPKSASSPALRVFGGATVRNLIIRSTLNSDQALVSAGPLAFLAIEQSRVTSLTQRWLVEYFENSQGEIGNSILTGGREGAVFSGSGAQVSIYANHGDTVIRRPGLSDGQAIGCYQGGFGVHASNPPASVTIGPSAYGISSRGCIAALQPEEGTSVKITGASHYGIELKSGDSYSLVRTSVVDNPGKALIVSAGVVEIDASTIGGNGAGIEAARGATIRFNSIYGPSSVTDTNDRYTCYQGGHIYSEPGYINGSQGESECLEVGGGSAH
jgi:hypothetical protein